MTKREIEELVRTVYRSAYLDGWYDGSGSEDISPRVCVDRCMEHHSPESAWEEYVASIVDFADDVSIADVNFWRDK
jgi:hypothetical protein